MTAPAADVRTAFEAAFGSGPAVVVRAPGRVNLIGEHTDYSNLPVLPIAIDRALEIAAAPAGEPAVEVHSTAFPGQPARLGSDGSDATAPWHRYAAGVLRELQELAPGGGARVLVTGDLPGDAGLSSSSALSVGLLAALNELWNLGLDRQELARRAAVSERHVGVETGGMDQAVIVHARAGHALRIDFDPPALHHVPIPPGLAFVIADSGERAEKGGNARDAYNERVIGARLAAAMLADHVGLDIPAVPHLRDLWGIDVVDVLIEELPEKIAVREVARSVSLDPGALARLSHGTFDTSRRVPVRNVARHILGEAGRVDLAQAALDAGQLDAFGRLMNESHESLRSDFGCSTRALDRVCAAMRRAGAFGARLTGAGFGGYAVAAVPPDRVEAVVAAALEATGGPAFEVHASEGLSVE